MGTAHLTPRPFQSEVLDSIQRQFVLLQLYLAKQHVIVQFRKLRGKIIQDIPARSLLYHAGISYFRFFWKKSTSLSKGIMSIRS